MVVVSHAGTWSLDLGNNTGTRAVRRAHVPGLVPQGVIQQTESRSSVAWQQHSGNDPPQNHRESRMKIWQILLVIWVVGVGFMMANHFNQQNIERMKKR